MSQSENTLVVTDEQLFIIHSGLGHFFRAVLSSPIPIDYIMLKQGVDLAASLQKRAGEIARRITSEKTLQAKAHQDMDNLEGEAGQQGIDLDFPYFPVAKKKGGKAN